MSFVESGIYYARMLAECQTQPAEDTLRNHLQVMLNKAQSLKAERDQLKAQLDEARELLEAAKHYMKDSWIDRIAIDAWLEKTK